MENRAVAGSPVARPPGAESLECAAGSKRRDSGFGEDSASALVSAPGSGTCVPAPAAPSSVSAGPDAISEVLCTLSLEVNKSQDSRNDAGEELDNKATAALPVSKNVNVKDILRSLVSTPPEGVAMEPALLPPSCLGALSDLSAEPPVQFRSFDRYAESLHLHL